MNKLFISLLFIILLVGSISALEIDNKKTYNSELKEVTIKNSFLGLFETSEVAKIKLLSEEDKICFTKSDCYAEFQINVNQKGRLLNQLEFYGKPSRFSSTLLNLNSNPNSEWKIYNSKSNSLDNINPEEELPIGDYKIRLYVDVNSGETIEFIPTFFGVRVNEWTSFTGATKLEFYDGATAGGSQGSATTTEWIAQGFRLNETMTLAGITIRAYSSENSSLNNITFGIWNATDSGTNSTPIVLVDPTKPESENSTVVNNIFSNNTTFREINITLPTVNLYADRNYSIGIHLTQNGSTIQVEQTSASNYEEGNRGKSTDNGVIFSTPGASEAWFQVWGIPANFESNSVSLISPSNQSSSVNNQFNFNASVTPFFAGNITNATLQIWNSTNSLINQTTNSLIGTSVNYSQWNVNLTQLDNYKWNVLGCTNNITSGGYICNYASSNYSFNYGIMNISSVFTSPVYQTETIFLEQNISLAEGYNMTYANLTWNGTGYPATTTFIAGNNYSLKRTIDVPSITGAIPFRWNVGLNNSIDLITGANTQTASLTNLSLCTGSLTTLFSNYTFKDEVSLNNINATITSVVVNYTLGTGQYNNTFTYSTASENPAYAFCVSPDKNATIDVSFLYSASSYPQRSYAPETFSWNSTNPFTQTLYLLSASDGLYVTFQVVNPSQQALSDVTVNATQGSTLVGQGITDAAGLVTFWVNPNNQHIFTFSKEGFEDFIYTTFPTQSSYTIIMGEGAAEEVVDYSKGVNINIQPPSTQTLYNQTVYNFNMTISSSFWDIDEYGFNLTLNNGTQVGFVNSTTVGLVGLNLNTVNYTQINMQYYWIINSSENKRVASWKVFNTGLNQWSISNLFTDLNLYLTSGLFGLDNFGRDLIVFLILFITVGIFSYKYGTSSPLALSMITFIIIYFFDIAFPILPQSINIFGEVAIPHFFTFLSGLIVAILVIREVQT